MNNQKSKNQKITDYLNRTFNGNHQLYMYFHEKDRHIAVVYTYDYQTGKGAYAASIWHHIPGKSNGRSFCKKTHRETAIQRFAKCRPVPFHIEFDLTKDVFYPKLKSIIRKTIMNLGVKGVRGGSSTDTSSEHISAPDIDLNEIVPYPTRMSTRSVLQRKQNKRPRLDRAAALAEAMH